jgi:hypothetical protein
VQREPSGHVAGTETSMEFDRRNFDAFRSYRLKSNNSLPQDRFNDLDRAEVEYRLERLADVRKAVVARGKALVADPSYPDKKTVRAVSRLLAKKMS